jgi:hypothetical protein
MIPENFNLILMEFEAHIRARTQKATRSRGFPRTSRRRPTDIQFMMPTSKFEIQNQQLDSANPKELRKRAMVDRAEFRTKIPLALLGTDLRPQSRVAIKKTIPGDFGLVRKM